MKVNGIIAEYNPFHNGHQYHLESSKKRTGADYTIVAMSGNFMQRGIPAMIHKQARAEMALKNGADLVLEIPSFWACGSAEYYAQGAVTLLDKLGVTDYLCFGSECGDVDVLTKIAKILLEAPDEYVSKLTDGLKKGYSYPAARSMALRVLFDKDEEVMDTFAAPNNILGIEYIKALLQINSTIKPVSIQRVGASYHETSLGESFPSATAVREVICKTQNKAPETIFDCSDQLKNQLPENTLSILKTVYQTVQPMNMDDFSQVLLYKLLADESCGYEKYWDITSDLSDKIKKNLFQYQSFSSFCELLKSKDNTYTRLSRCLMHVLLDIKKDDMARYQSLGYVPYARVLGLRRDAAELLRTIKERSKIPLVSKLANAKDVLEEDALGMFEKDVWISHVYNGVESVKCGTDVRNEYRAGVIVV